MPEPGLARRYATALFEAAKKRNRLDPVAADLGGVVQLVDREPALREFLLSPQVLDEHKEEIVNRVMGPLVDPLVHHFLHLLLEKRRFDHLELVHRSVVEQVDAYHGIVEAVVTTAIELTPELRDRLRSRLEAATRKNVRLECRTEPSILGGVIVVLGDQLLDASVQTEVRRMREELMAVRVI